MVVICLSRCMYCMYCFRAPYNLRFHSLTVNGNIILVLLLSYRSFLRVHIQYLKCKAFFQQKIVKALKSCTLRYKYSFLPEKTLTNSSYPVQTYHHSLQGKLEVEGRDHVSLMLYILGTSTTFSHFTNLFLLYLVSFTVLINSFHEYDNESHVQNWPKGSWERTNIQR